MGKIKQTGKAIKLSDQRLKNLVANVPGIVYQFQISPDGKRSLPYVSPTVFKYFGLTAEEVMQDVERWFVLTHPDDLPGLEASIIESMETMSQWQWEGRFIKNESDIRWFRGSSNPEKLDDGSILWNGVFTDITQQRKTEEALIESEKRLRSILNNTSAVVYVKNLDGQLILINKKFEELIGVTREDVIGKTSYDFFPKEVADEHRKNDLEVIKRRVSVESEETVPLSDGVHTYLSVKFCLFDAKGEPYAVCGISTDITERKKAEEILRNSKQELETLIEERTDELEIKNAQCQVLLENAVDSIFFYDEQGSFFGSNKHAQEVLGYTEEELNKRAIFDIDPAVTPEQVLPVLKSLEPGKIGEFEGVHQRKDGSWFHVDVRTASYIVNEKKLFVGIARDVSARKQVEQRLRESQERLSQLLSSSPVFIYSCDVRDDFRPTFISENVRDLFGYESEYWLQTPKLWADGIHPDDVQRVFEDLEALYENDYHVHEYRFRLPDGSYVWVHDELKLLRDENGGPSSIIGFWTDITDRKNADKQIIAAKEEAEFANQSKSEFLSRMSHELRTPLNAILGFAQLLKMKNESLSDDQNLGVEHILSGGKHLLHLIDDVLDLSKVDAGKVEISIEDVFLQDVFDSSVRFVRSLAEKHEVAVNYYPEIKYHVRADRRRLEQVMVNLLSNAIKYNHKGGKVDISIETVGDDTIRISVSDTGCGIKSEYQKDLYEPFNRIPDTAGLVEGTGIGLTITKNLVEAMDGSIGLKSEFGRGSTFWVDMRATSPTSLPGQTQILDGDVVSDYVSTGDLKVLYVEDNPANTYLMQQIFRQTMDCELLTATTAEKGIEIAKENALDLILMDINLPGMDGVEALKALKADIKTAHIPIVAVSAHAMPDQIESGRREGFTDYLSKPVRVEELVTIIREIAP
jgi:PAS domain S-box-containing protein